MNNDNDTMNYNDNLEAVNKLGVGYFAALVFKVESYPFIMLEEIIRNIVGHLIRGEPISPKQASILMRFKNAFDPRGNLLKKRGSKTKFPLIKH